MKWLRRTGGWALGLTLLVLTGCATHRIDWPGRVGDFTFDQAVAELGPPEKQARLSDGAVVADWLLRRSRSAFTSSFGAYYGGPGWAFGGPVYLGPDGPDYFLRLTFGANGQLSAWKKFAR